LRCKKIFSRVYLSRSQLLSQAIVDMKLVRRKIPAMWSRHLN
jgi:hypothetical protein